MWEDINWLQALSGLGVSVIFGLIGLALNTRHNRSFRQTRKGLSRVQSSCPHSVIRLEDDALVSESTFVSPVGRTDYVCQRCGLAGIFSEGIVRHLSYYSSLSGLSPKEMRRRVDKREKAFRKAIRRYDG